MDQNLHASRENHASIAIQLENARTTEFITNCASVMTLHGLIGARDSQHLRAHIHRFQQDHEQSQHLWDSILCHQGGFTTILGVWFGPKNLARNLLSKHLDFHTDGLILELCQLGEILSRQIRLVFNRKIVTHQDQMPYDQTLFPSLIANYTEQIERCVKSAQKIQTSFQLMHCLDSSARSPWIDDLVQATGFQKLNQGIFVRTMSLQSIDALASVFSCWISSTDELCELLGGTSELEAAINLKRIGGKISELTGMARKMEEPHLGTEREWAHYISTISSLVARLTALGAHVSENVVALLKTTLFDQNPDYLFQTDRLGLQAELIRQGHTPARSEDAVRALAKYCGFHKIAPSHLIVNELSRIDPIFGAGCHKWLNDHERRLEPSRMVEEKRENLKKASFLQEFFTTTLTSLVILTLICLSSISCGVKGAPRSQLVELRPQVPFVRSPEPVPAKTEVQK